MITVCNTKSPDLLHFCMSWICYICSRCCRCGRCSRCDRCGRCWQCISFGHFHHGNLAMPQTNVMSHIDLTFRISNCIKLLFYSNNNPFSKINKKHTIELQIEFQLSPISKAAIALLCHRQNKILKLQSFHFLTSSLSNFSIFIIFSSFDDLRVLHQVKDSKWEEF